MSGTLLPAQQAKTAASSLLQQAKAHDVTDATLADNMTALVEYADGEIKKLENARKLLVKPLNDQVRFINAEFKAARETYEAASREGRAKLKPWLAKLEKEQREREQEERKAAEEAARKLAEQKAAEQEAAPPAGDKADSLPPKMEPPPPPPPPAAPDPLPPPAKPQGRNKKAHTRKVKKWRITDMAKIPQKYFALDTKLVDAAMKDGEFIPGIEYYEDSEVVMR
mgnify:CR=1 FL=1